jgi:hypothetical protein
MYFPNAFRKSFLPDATLLGVGLASSGSTADLVAGKIGYFDAKTFAALGSTAQASPFILAQGSYFVNDKIGPVHGGYRESLKSKMINPKYVSRLIKVSAKSPVQQVVKVSVNAGLAADSTFRLRVDVKGSPALRLLNHQLYKTVDAYTGCVNTANPSYVKDPVSALLLWKDQINSAILFNQMVSARVYKWVISTSATAIGVAATTTSVTITVTNTSMAVGQKVIGTGIPANAFITALVSTTGIVVTYPTQSVAPTISATVSVKAFTDVYTEAGTIAYIPGTGANQTANTAASAGVATGLTSAAYSASADATSFTYTENPFLEITVGYLETKFGGCSTHLGTFTPTDKYDLEPLIVYASVKDESGDPCFSSSFVANSAVVSASNPYLSSHGVQVQAPSQAQGSGETVLRELILDGRYLQNAFPDSSRVESIRMREIEGDPAYLKVDRTALYDKVLILHNVPRFYNPSGHFDNDQYLIVINVPAGTSTSALTTFITSSCTAAGNSVSLETY